ncbi:MAG: hypothetical protein HC908_01650 [Calothrix sp. SM1_7_51]|nr:hypothetical protein [Calothrix sp. SM1_7_51]
MYKLRQMYLIVHKNQKLRAPPPSSIATGVAIFSCTTGRQLIHMWQII